eukprot:1203710-Amphidinium_carterae.1
MPNYKQVFDEMEDVAAEQLVGRPTVPAEDGQALAPPLQQGVDSQVRGSTALKRRSMKGRSWRHLAPQGEGDISISQRAWVVEYGLPEHGSQGMWPLPSSGWRSRQIALHGEVFNDKWRLGKQLSKKDHRFCWCRSTI